MWEQLELLIKEFNNLKIENAIDYKKFSMISIVWHSTKIEGCSLTETDTKVLIDKDITAQGKPLLDHLMVKDHYDALLFIQQEALKKRKLSLDFIQEINRKVMCNTGSCINTALGNFDTSKGDFRLLQVYVEKKYFPNYSKVADLLDNLCTITNKSIENVKGNDIIKLAADVHYNFVNIHPFGDGNGRTARLLMNYIQLFHQQPLIKIFTEDRTEYIDALNHAEEQENIDIFRDFIYRQQIKFLSIEIEKFKKMNTGYSFLF